MASTQLINSTSDHASVAKLQRVYDSGLIVAEKKPFLVDLKRSFGSLLAVADNDQFILDACSQIATLGLGFNAGPLFAPCHHLEAWTGDYTTKNIQAIADSYRNLLKRLLGDTGSGYHVHFCSSGAEAVEISLGVCFANRVNKSANRVLAFEGAFHGRMMVALSATWNAKKREPFAWPGYETTFAPYPFTHGDEDVVAQEENAIAAIEQHLSSGKFFAILIEPMQCEGGDRYSSSRFHNRLLQLANQYNTPLVYDEVQTGFHLGSEFFWHSQFELSDEHGNATGPDAIACAKKSQVGIVISKQPVPFKETFCPASLIRGYAVASVIEQFDDEIAKMEAEVKLRLPKLIAKHESLIGNPRSQGLAFAFDFLDADSLNKFVGNRFNHGLLFYSAGQKTARFRLSLAFRDQSFDVLWRQLDQCLDQCRGQVESSSVASVDVNKRAQSSVSASYEFHERFVSNKFSRLAGQTAAPLDVSDYLQAELRRLGIGQDLTIVLLNAENYSQFRDRILRMQDDVYEPARRSPPEEFDSLFNGTVQTPAILVLAEEKIIAMAFCGPLSTFRQERGVPEDPYVDDEDVFYMLDLTVAETFRGGTGTAMKNAIALLAADMGVSAVHGRNRDRHARGMWAINLGLGGYETQHLFDDYPDNDQYRDCLYYRMLLSWEQSKNQTLPFATLDTGKLSECFVARNLPTIVNKVCLSNFATGSFLDDLQFVAKTLPRSIRRIYTASSLSESIDKIAKAIWMKRKPANRLLTIAGHYFGEGSFLSRSLSGVGEAFFEATRLESDKIEEQLESCLSTEQWLGLFVQTERFVGQEQKLAACVAACRAHSVPIIFNETGPRFGTKSQLSRQEGLLPDAGVAWLGGQMALAYTGDSFYADNPLLLISTWDGDAYALARFAETMKQQN